MKPVTREWIEKAEGDYHTAGILLRARKYPNYDHSCFHAQQCAEKYIKAALVEANNEPIWTHDLTSLLDQLTAVMPERELLRPYCTILTDYAVRFRYPGSSADKAMARDAVRSCKFIRDSLREVLGLPAATEKSGKKKKAVRRIRE